MIGSYQKLKKNSLQCSPLNQHNWIIPIDFGAEKRGFAASESADLHWLFKLYRKALIKAAGQRKHYIQGKINL